MIRENGKLPDDILRRIPKLVDSLAGDKDVVALYSFGSLAQNALKPLSDLDFGILLSCQMGKKEFFDKLNIEPEILKQIKNNSEIIKKIFM